MFFLSADSNSPYINLATEEVLHRRHSEEFCMLWQNSSSVIVGQNQNTVEEIDFRFVTDNKIPVVRRMTGGGAVFHDMGNLNFSYIVNGGSFGDWAGFTKMLRDYLNTLGVDASLSGRNDVTVDGRKISGNAQCVYHNRLLHHGTILVSADMSYLSSALRPDPEKMKSSGIKSVKSRVANINEFVDISIDEFRRGFEKYLRAHTMMEDYVVSDRELDEINELAETKYKTYEWNFGYSPKYTFRKKERFTGGTLEIYLYVEGGVIFSADIYGDFFARGDTSQIKDALCGTRYTPEDLDAAVSRIWQEGAIGAITKEEFLSCLM